MTEFQNINKYSLIDDNIIHLQSIIPSLRKYFDVVKTNNGFFKHTLSTSYPIDEEEQGEGNDKREVSSGYYLITDELSKITAYTKVSDELLEDIDFIGDDIALDLVEQVSMLETQGVLQDLHDNYSTDLYIPDDLVGNVNNPTYRDVVSVAMQYLQLVSGAHPNLLVINPVTLAKLDMQKSDNGEYYNFYLNGNVFQLQILQTPYISEGIAYLIDTSYFKLIVNGINVYKETNDDSIHNLTTLIAEERFKLVWMNDSLGCCWMNFEEAVDIMTIPEPEPSTFFTGLSYTTIPNCSYASSGQVRTDTWDVPVLIDWGDGSELEEFNYNLTSTPIEHTYATAGQYTVKYYTETQGIIPYYIGWNYNSAYYPTVPFMQSITIPEGVAELDNLCFNKQTNLTEVHLPTTITHLSSPFHIHLDVYCPLFNIGNPIWSDWFRCKNLYVQTGLYEPYYATILSGIAVGQCFEAELGVEVYNYSINTPAEDCNVIIGNTVANTQLYFSTDDGVSWEFMNNTNKTSTMTCMGVTYNQLLIVANTPDLTFTTTEFNGNILQFDFSNYQLTPAVTFGYANGSSTAVGQVKGTDYGNLVSLDSEESTVAYIETHIKKPNVRFSGVGKMWMNYTINSLRPVYKQCLKSAKLSDPELTEIGGLGFSQCSALETVEINAPNLTSLPNNCFVGAQNLTSVIITSPIISIPSNFVTTPLLEILVLPNGLEIIRDYAFKDFLPTFLTNGSFHIPASVTYIRNYAFTYKNITSLTTIIIHFDGNTPPTFEGTALDFGSNARYEFYVPAGASDRYDLAFTKFLNPEVYTIIEE